MSLAPSMAPTLAPTRLLVLPWQLDVAQRLDEHHLCATSSSPQRRGQFACDLVAQFGLLPETEVCWLDGSAMTDLGSFGGLLADALHPANMCGGNTRGGSRGIGSGGRLELTSIDAIVWALRRRFTRAGVRPIKRRFFIWSDAHVLLARDPYAFGAIVDAMMGVAAEGEFASEDMLLLQRCVFIGRPALEMYAEDERGQFRSWLRESGEQALWSVVSGLDAPVVQRVRIDDVLRSAETVVGVSTAV